MEYKESLKNFIQESKKLTDNVIDNKKRKNEKMELADGAIIGLYEQIIQKSEDLYYLISNNRYASGNIILRVIFEEYIYLTFILRKRKDTVELANAYFYSSKLQEFKIYNSIKQDSDCGKEVRNMLGFVDIQSFTDDLNSNNKTEYKTYEEFYNHINKEYQKIRPNIKKNGKEFPRSWFNYNGQINHFRDLCKFLDKEYLYVLTYKVFSANVHGNRPNEAIKIIDNEAYIGEIQFGSDQLIASMISSFLFALNKDIYTYYKMDSELRNYNSIIAIKYSAVNKSLVLH